MLEEIHSCLKNLENSYMLSFREVTKETKKLSCLLDNFKELNEKNVFKKTEILSLARSIEDLSIKNEYKLSLITDFPEYFSNIKLKK